MGLFDAIGGGLKGLFGEGFGDKLVRSVALANGDTAAAAAITAQMQKRKDNAAEDAQKQQLAQRIYSTAKSMGWSDDEASVLAANPEKAAQVFAESHKAPDQPGIAKEYDWYNGLAPGQRSAVDAYMSKRFPGMTAPVTIPYGAQVIGGGNSAGGALKLNPQTGQWEPEGGAGGNASGGFPNGPYPPIGPYNRY